MNEHPDQIEPKSSSREKSMKIYTEELKGSHTTHWDMDYLTAEQVEAAYHAGRSSEDGSPRGEKE